MKEVKIRFGWIDKRTYGLCEDNKITLNIYLWLAETFIHEFYHFKYPKDSEKMIEKRTEAKLRRMSNKEIIRLAKGLLWNYYNKMGR